VEEFDWRGFEFVFVVEESLAEQGDWVCGVGEFMEEPGGGQEGIGEDFFPVVFFVLVDGDEESGAFCVEDDGDSVEGFICIVYIVGGVFGDYVEGGDRDDFDGVVCEVHNFCHSDGDSQAGEGARADGDVDVVDLAGGFGESV